VLIMMKLAEKHCAFLCRSFSVKCFVYMLFSYEQVVPTLQVEVEGSYLRILYVRLIDYYVIHLFYFNCICSMIAQSV
jgi:hypothetical protein